MRYFKHTTTSSIIFLSGFIPFMVCVNTLLFGKRYLVEFDVWWKATLIVLPSLFFKCSLMTLFAGILRERWAGPSNAVKRGLTVMLVTFFSTVVLITSLASIFHRTHFMGYSFDSVNYLLAILASLVITIISSSLFEADFLLDQWKSTHIETELLKKKNLQNKLDKLKEQVNPHFLFNSLNCLSSLISENAERAGRFLNEMSMVYRYLLSSNEEHLTPLSGELKFMRSYFHLLETRYGPGIQLQINVAERMLQYQIPSLTLQLLVENAIKHNVVLKNKPLQIDIHTTDDDRLVITNNLQPKLLKPPSNKVGLTNIAEKYKLMNQAGMEVQQSDSSFCVKIPLIRMEHEMA